jgi:pyruvate carboxylase subunit B
MKYFVTVRGREIEVVVEGERVTVDGAPHVAHLSELAGTALRLLVVDGRPAVFPLERLARGRWIVTAAGERLEVGLEDERSRHIRSLLGPTGTQAGGGSVRAPMPGLVVRVLVVEGDQVAAGQGLMVLEAMKMENEIRAPGPGVVKAVTARAGAAVEKGQVLVELGEPGTGNRERGSES